MFSKTAQYYDLIYHFKDYKHETRLIETLIRQEHPDAKTVLDVGCGTGEHLKYLSESFQVDGMDIQPEFVEIARKKAPSARFWQADMSNFTVDVQYDVVLCLFSSIGYLTQPAQVMAALECFKNHMNPRGVIIVEPWFTPDQWKVGNPYMMTVDQPDLKICRMNISDREGNLSIIKFHYLIGTPGRVEYVTEIHTLALYSHEEMLDFFKQTDLSVRYDPEGNTGRGLYIANLKK